MTSAGRPAFAYLSLPADRRPDTETRWRRALAQAAALEGLELRSVFVDERDQAPCGFTAMHDLLRRGDVRVVLLPDLTHVDHIAVVARLTRAGLGRYLDSAVLLAATRATGVAASSVRS